MFRRFKQHGRYDDEQGFVWINVDAITYVEVDSENDAVMRVRVGDREFFLAKEDVERSIFLKGKP